MYPKERIVYDKIVRDKVPQHLDSQGIPYGRHHASTEDLMGLFTKKLEEERGECEAEKNVAAIEKELIDILEVKRWADYHGIILTARDPDRIQKMYDTYWLDPEKVETLRQEKYLEKGGFEKGIVLEYTHEKAQ